MLSLVNTWGSTETERAESWPCDALLEAPHLVAWRAVDVDAPTEVVYRWLCQLKVAPYSYDWIDNFGRRSPRTLTPGVDSLEVGERMVAIFRLADFEPGRSLTLLSRGRVFGRVAMTYRVTPAGPDRARLAAKILARFPSRSPLRPLLHALLPAGDLVMMRRQLLNLKALAEESVPELVG
jgi:hypothetical protein